MNRNILINAISARNGGGVTYIKNILPFFIKHKANHKITVLLLEDNSELESLHELKGINKIAIKMSSDNLIQRMIFELIRLPIIMQKNNFDILFSPGGTSLTMKSKFFKSITMFRNVWPHYHSNSIVKTIKNIIYEPLIFIKLKLLKVIIILNCRNLDKTIYISNHGYNLINKGKKSKNKSIVIKHAINNIFFENQNLETNFNLISKKYIFYVSSFLPYKNHEILLRAYSNARHEFLDCPLVLVGKISAQVKSELQITISNLGIKNDVYILEEVAPKVLAGLYQNSFFNLFLSSCENCPNTMLEAMASNRPLLSSNKTPCQNSEKIL